VLLVRKPPPGRRFLVAAGLEQALDHLEALRFDAPEIGWLVALGGLPAALAPKLRDFPSFLAFDRGMHRTLRCVASIRGRRTGA
jgi:nicotinic acid phosphoribosyltransferase